MTTPVWLGLNEVPIIPKENYGIMGILNLTPDSFYDGGLYNNNDRAYAHFEKMADRGADIIDIGGESSRPGGKLASGGGSLAVAGQEEEWRRLESFLKFLDNNIEHGSRTYISVDTWRSDTAKNILRPDFKANLDITIINDISGCQWDRKLIDVLVDYQPGYVLMYNSSSPLEMFPENRNLFQSGYINDHKLKTSILTKVKNYFEIQLERLTKGGLKENHIILDPGIGFAKTIDEDLTILANLNMLQCLGRPLLIGISMKSMLGKLFRNLPGHTGTLPSDTALFTLAAARKGALWHRVHNIYDTKIALKTLELLNRYSIEQ